MTQEQVNFINAINIRFQHPIGTFLKKKSGSNWHGKVVGFYITEQSTEGYCLESIFEKGSVQLYPAQALEIMEETK